MTTIVGPHGARTGVDGQSVDTDDLAAVTGWMLKPEGLCRDDVCIVVPDELRNGDRVDAVGLWRRLDRPVLTAGDATYLGEAATTRASALVGGVAPDFRLRDLAGAEHTLSDQRGRKVLLVSWAPW